MATVASRAHLSVCQRRRFPAALLAWGFTPCLQRQSQLLGLLVPGVFRTHSGFALPSVRPFVSTLCVPDSHACQGYLEMCLGKFLNVVDAVDGWVVSGLGQSGLQQQMQDHLSVLRVVLIPRVVHGLASAGQRQSRNQPQLEALAVEKIRQRPMDSCWSLQSLSRLSS